MNLTTLLSKCRPTASASPGSLLENSGLTQDLMSHNLNFDRIPKFLYLISNLTYSTLAGIFLKLTSCIMKWLLIMCVNFDYIC